MQTLTLPGILESLKTIREHVMAAAEEAGLGNRAANRLVLAVDEIATNVIMHAYEEAGRDGGIALLIEIDEHRLKVTLEDEGERFNPNDHGEPDHLRSSLEERPIGGLGVYLALRGVDRFEYEFVQGKNRNIFIMERPGG